MCSIFLDSNILLAELPAIFLHLLSQSLDSDDWIRFRSEGPLTILDCLKEVIDIFEQ